LLLAETQAYTASEAAGGRLTEGSSLSFGRDLDLQHMIITHDLKVLFSLAGLL